MLTYRSVARTWGILSRAPLAGPMPIPSNSQFAGTPMTTFRSYAQAPPSKDIEQQHEQSGPQAPNTDEIAHSDAAFSGDTADPGEAKDKLEAETSGSMNQSAANPDASKPPQKPLQTSKSEAQKSGSSQ